VEFESWLPVVLGAGIGGRLLFEGCRQPLVMFFDLVKSLF
jgi:hypothetical protein